MGLPDLLKANNLEQHPFAAWRAEDEERDLPKWFIPPPFFDDMLGKFGNLGTHQILKPASHIVFGMPGGGKTATRRMLETHLLNESPNSLVIRYTDFNRVLQRGGRPSLSRHVGELLSLGTTSLLAICARSTDRYERLTAREKVELAGLVKDYYEVLTQANKHAYSKVSPYWERATAAAKIAGDLYNLVISVLKKERLEPAKWNTGSDDADKAEPMIRLQRFWSLVNAMGFENIWVLVDGVDEDPQTRTTKAMFDCLAEILLNQRLMEFREEDRQVMCFKIFLTRPEEFQPLLDAERFRKDRIPVRMIQWQRKHLDMALKRRLAYYSNNSILSFDELCEGRLKGTHDRMLDECGLNPRTLFLMGYQTLAAFQNMESGLTKIDKESIDEGIRLAKASAPVN